MEKGKLIPLISAAVLVVLAVIIAIVNQINSTSFEKLIVTYKGQKNEYKQISVDDVIVVKDVSFWVVSKVKQTVVLNSSQVLNVNNKDRQEIEVNLNKLTEVCFSENECITFQLV